MVEAGTLDTVFSYGMGADGPVYALTYATTNQVIVGGDFTTLNAARVARVARIFTNGLVDANFNPGTGPNAAVYAVAVHTNYTNAVIIGGAFTSVDGTPRNYFARLLSNGLLDPTFVPGTGPNGPVHALAVDTNGYTILGGAFTSVDGIPSPGVARLDANGNVDASFIIGAGANGTVRSIAVQTNGQILIAGDFTTYNGLSLPRIARLNTNGVVDPTFQPNLGANATVNSLALQTNGLIVVAGSFTTFNGFTVNGITRLNVDGSRDATFNPGTGATGGGVNSVVVRMDGKLLLGGTFTAVNGIARNGYARLNVDGSVDSTFDPGVGVNGAVNAVATLIVPPPPVINLAVPSAGQGADTNFIATGSTFGTVTVTWNMFSIPDEIRIYYGTNLVATNLLFASGYVTQTGSVTLAYGPGIETFLTITIDQVTNVPNSVWNYAVQIVPGGFADKVTAAVIGGDFTSVAGLAQPRVAFITDSALPDSSFGVGTLPRTVLAMGSHTNPAVPSLLGKLVVGGTFGSLGGVNVGNVARLNADGTVDLGFSPGVGSDGPINALVVQPDGKVVLGGAFTNYNGQTRTNLVRVNANGTVDTSYNSFAGANNPVLALALQTDGKVVAGGDFNSVNATPRNFITRLNTDGTVDATFNPGTGADASVRALAVQADGKIVLGGDFSVVAGSSRTHLARLNSNGSLDAGYSPVTDARVLALALAPGGQALIGGDFSSVNGTNRSRVARLNTTGTLDLGFDPGLGLDDYVATLAVQADGRVLAGGGFVTANGLLRNHLVRFNADGTVDSSINFGVGTDDAVNTLLIEFNDDRIVFGGAFTNFNGSAVDHVARVNGRYNQGTGVLAFNAGSYSVSEGAATTLVTISRFNGLTNTLSGVFTNAGGTATQGVHYLLPITNLNFAAGQTTTNLPVTIVDDGVTNADRVATLAVVSAGVTNTATLTILDNDAVLNFSLASYSVVENNGYATITVLRIGGAADTYLVSYQTADGTARAGVDYTNASGQLFWLDGDATPKTFTVGVTDNLVTNSPKTVLLSLSGGTNLTLATAVTLTGQTNAVLTILDNEFGPGAIGFSASAYSISETGSVATITVVRTNGSVGAVGVNYTTANGTALAGTDYTGASGSFTWANGDASVRTFNVGITDNFVTNANKTVSLQLSGISGGAASGTLAATLTIVDNDSVFTFGTNAFSVNETNGSR